MTTSYVYANEFFEFMKKIHLNGHNVNVSTMTVLCHLDIDSLDIQMFSENFNHEFVTVKFSNTPKNFTVTKRGKVKKSFFNQVTLNYSDTSKKSIKIFSNGKLQITGISSQLESEYVINNVVDWINKTLDIQVQPKSIYIGMINSNFSIHRCINLISLNRILNTFADVISVYNPESYPAINMKYFIDECRISIFIFGTGNIVITGAKCISHISTTYDFIVNILNNTPDILRSHNVRLYKDESIIDGYTIRHYQSCVY